MAVKKMQYQSLPYYQNTEKYKLLWIFLLLVKAGTMDE